MDTHRLVLPEDLNQYGFLFGGRLLGWVDEASWIAASLDFPDCRFVTLAMDEVIFRHGAKEGDILAIESNVLRKGRTSVTYTVHVFKGRAGQGSPVFTTRVTFVNVDSGGNKTPLTNP